MAKPKQQLKWKRKEWYKIIAPDLFNNKVLGETPATEREQVIGRTLYKNVGRLLEDKSKQYMRLKFRITDVEGDKAKTSIDGFKVSRSHVSKAVRREMTKLDVVEEVKTKDGKDIQIQLLILPLGKVSKEERRGITNKAQEEIKKFGEKNNLQTLFLMVISQDVQKKLKSMLNKVYPIKYVQIKKIKT